MVRQAAREGAFAISADMLSLAGVGHEAMAEILTDLGYRRGEDVEEEPRFIARRREPKRRPEGEKRPERGQKSGKPKQQAGDGEKRERKDGPRKPKRKDGGPRGPKGPKVISSNGPAMRPEDSPFAVLQQLKLAK